MYMKQTDTLGNEEETKWYSYILFSHVPNYNYFNIDEIGFSGVFLLVSQINKQTTGTIPIAEKWRSNTRVKKLKY